MRRLDIGLRKSDRKIGEIIKMIMIIRAVGW